MPLDARLDRLTIEPRGPLDARPRVPGSKSITNRALLLAALAEGESVLRGGLDSDDTVVMRAALEALGVGVQNLETNAGDDAGYWRVEGRGGRFRPPGHALDCGNSGTSARFLTAALTLGDGEFVVDGNARMRERPISDLASALLELGATIEVEGRAECPPVRIRGGALPGGTATIDGSRSSQYVSAVLQAAPYAQRDVELRFKEGVVVSRPYIDLTLEVMRAFGARAEWVDETRLRVHAGVPYQPRDYAIEPDSRFLLLPV